MCVSLVIGAIATAAAVAGTVVQYNAAKDQAKANKKIAQIQTEQASTDNQRYKRQVYRQMLQAQAQSEAAGAAQGGTYGSAVAGGVNQAAGSALTSQADSNTNFEFARQIGTQQQKIASAQGQGALGSAISSLGGALSKSTGTITKIGQSFTSPGTKAYSMWS